MSPRALLAALMLLAGAAAVPAVAAAPPALAGTTVVTGSAIGAMQVRVPRAATISLLPNADSTQGAAATFRGTGRLLAAVLVRRPVTDEVWLTSRGVCMTAGCSGERRFFGTHRTPGVPSAPARLDPGTYTLYWITDGKPASVTLRFGGLSGRATLRPPAVGAMQWGPGSVLDGVDPVTSTGVRSYGGETGLSLPRRGVVVLAEYVVAKTMQARTSVCAGSGDGAPDPASPCLTTRGDDPALAMTSSCDCVVSSRQDEFGVVGFLPLAKGTYTLRSEAHYAGRFGATGLAVVALPYV